MERTPDGVGQRVKEIVADALQHDRAERGAFVQQACGDDSALRAEALALLDLEAQADAVFGAPTATATPEVSAVTGRRIGGYEIREVIGSGGMGTVYEAVQSCRPRQLTSELRRALHSRLGRQVLVGLGLRSRPNLPDPNQAPQ